MKRDRFLFYRSFVDVTNALPEECRLDFLTQLIIYALDKEEPSFSNELETLAWIAIKPNIDSNWNSYIGGKTGGNGRPKRNGIDIIKDD